ncbi:DNA-binding MarR family transcriptional regulator [Lipingzhangella halophila]|uniref:DNA-binding MarR family transcriptional regulator n=1 Tax=Lipingzhangella halophila TaxID=1783352 RepID=A0A7W7W4T9_9ACTN|nr:transcriptional regulator [Lipingzhangella halophila]MBB4933164.1 DNA-binding MarR family transcriptional regulator [Lipingzhangella halophila]
MATHATSDGFDPVIHAPQRLRICALLDSTDQAEFGFVQERLSVTASVLSKHVSVLMDAGYVKQNKFVRNARQRVWLSLTKAGRAAYRDHVAALRAIVEQDSES